MCGEISTLCLLKVLDLELRVKLSSHTFTCENSLELIQTKRNVHLHNTCIEKCHCIGQLKADRFGPLVNEFPNFGSKKVVYGKRKSLKESDVVITGDLFQYTMELLKGAWKNIEVD